MPTDQVIPVAAPIDTEFTGRGGAIASRSCVRVVCRNTDKAGTGFIHASGNVITAEHVVRGCATPVLVLPSLNEMPARVIGIDPVLDLAILEPGIPISSPPMMLSRGDLLTIGSPVSTWGFPSGYQGAGPMLSAGYLAAVDAHLIDGRRVDRWVVNAAFNSGNSGGPLLQIETGEVIGVVSSKLAPISQWSQEALRAMEGSAAGAMYTVTYADGSTKQLVEGQIVASILNELRSQVQLVIGYAVTLNDLKSFLVANGLEA